MWLRHEKGWKHNINMTSGFIVGLPTETKESVEAWAEKLMDFNYPLDSFSITPLGLNPKAARESKSEFERDYEKYGYYFDPAKSTSWVNEHWCYEDAVKLSTDLIRYAFASGRCKVLGFQSLMLQGYGYNWNDVFSLPSSYLTDGLFQKTKRMSKAYYTKLLNQ